MGKQGQKTKRGEGEIYDEVKSHRQNILLTPTAANILKAMAIAKSISISETVEQWLRQSYPDHDIAADSDQGIITNGQSEET